MKVITAQFCLHTSSRKQSSDLAARYEMSGQAVVNDSAELMSFWRELTLEFAQVDQTVVSNDPERDEQSGSEKRSFDCWSKPTRNGIHLGVTLSQYKYQINSQ